MPPASACMYAVDLDTLKMSSSVAFSRNFCAGWIVSDRLLPFGLAMTMSIICPTLATSLAISVPRNIASLIPHICAIWASSKKMNPSARATRRFRVSLV